MGDPVGDIIGDYRAFAARQHDRLLDRGIDIAPYALSHLAVRVAEWDDYVRVRALLERRRVTNSEGFHHVDDWVPQRLVTATGPNPLPR